MSTKRKWDNHKNITTDIAYIAGFFDGEGCIRIKKVKSCYYLVVHITNSNKSILEFIQERFDGKISFQERGVHKTIYQFQLNCGQANDFLKSVIGFLKEKKEQALIGIKFHETKHSLSMEQKELLYIKMREMKKIEIIGNIHQNPELLKG